MGNPVKFKYGTEAQILALESTAKSWVELAFYYPSDKNYFYQAVNGVMKVYGKTESSESISEAGITLNDSVIGGVKEHIEADETLNIPEKWAYNTRKLKVDGRIKVNGRIRII